MLKKFMSDALLSVVMDKRAREKLKQRQDAQNPKSMAKHKTTSDNPDNNADVLATISAALAEARAEVAGDEPTNTPSRPANTKVPPQTKATRKHPPVKESTPERQELIRQAMSIHRQKQDVLNELPAEMREKLLIMAMYAIDPESLSPEARKIAEAEQARETSTPPDPADDIGSAARPQRKPRAH